MRTARVTAAVATTCLLLVAGCSAGDTDSAPQSGSDPADALDDEDRADADVGDGEAPTDDGGAADDDAADDGTSGGGADDVVTFGGTGDAAVGRQLARTASIILEVEDIEQAATRVSAAAQRAGGFVSDAEVRGGDFGSGFLTLRVPARALDATIEDLATVGLRVVESSISTEDLTDQLTDLQARIDNLERLETELQALLSDVRDTDPQATQLLQVFERLTQVRGDIERLEAQRAAAQDRVALATIHVELLPQATAPEEVEPEPEGTIAQAWETTKDAFGAIADVLIWLVVTILPVTLAVVGVPALLLWALVTWLRRRRNERVAAAPAPPAPPGARDPGTHEPGSHDPGTHDPGAGATDAGHEPVE